MKNKIHKILGVSLTLVIAMALVMGFAAPAGAAVEKINEWYTFDYPVEGADGDWFMDPSITRVGEITEAIDGTLYVHVQRDVPDATFDISDETGTITFTSFGNTNPPLWTGTVVADMDGEWDTDAIDAFLPTDFVAYVVGEGAFMAISGTLTATNVSFEGSIAAMFNFSSGTETVTSGGFDLVGGGFFFGGMFDSVEFGGAVNGPGQSVFKSTDGARTWEETDYPGGWVVDMAASSIDADILYVADGHYVHKTDDAGETWSYVGKDSLEEQLSGICDVPACCSMYWEYRAGHYFDESILDPEYCPSCSSEHPWLMYPFTCPITSVDVTYNDDDNPYVFIGTRKHSSGIDLDDDGWFDSFPGEVYWIGEAGYPANWSGMGLDCYREGTYDALAVGCAPDWADSKETYVVVSTDDDDGDGIPGNGINDYQTHVVSTTGGHCDWPEYAELLWDCTDSFASSYASRIAFPDDWEDTGTLFVGVTDCFKCNDVMFDLDEQGGDVYMVMDGSALDMNVAGITTGCIGIESVDIISLDIEGDTDEASLIAGAFCAPYVYYSYDGGWEWDRCEKEPTGAELTYTIWYEDTALAVTSGYECAVSMSCVSDDVEDVGEAWNQISLMSTDIDSVLYIDHSPGYVCGDSETMFMLTFYEPGCGFSYQQHGYADRQSLFRHDGTYWERVFCNVIAGVDHVDGPEQLQRVRVSPDFNDTNCVYVTNRSFEIWRSTDAGCSWNKLTFPCTPRPCIGAAVVIDEDTVITGGSCCGTGCDDAQGYVYKTTRHGARPWDEYELPEGAGNANFFALEPGYEDPGSVLLGDDDSQVFISEDGGEEWDLVGDCQTVLDGGNYDTWVIFDPAYATTGIIYAAAEHVIARCIIDPDADWADQEWEELCDDLDNAAGIAAAGDTALYVTDDDDVDYPNGMIYDGGVLRSLNPDAEDVDDVVFERIGPGLEQPDDGDPELRHLWLTCDTSDEGCAENVLWSLEQYDEDPENIWVYEDTLAAPVVLDMPLDEQKLGTTDEATLSWAELCGADCYEVSLWSYCAECPDQKMAVDLCLDCDELGDTVACGPEVECDDRMINEHEVFCCPCTEEICIVVDDLEPGSTYYWQVRVCQGKPTFSKWSEERSFLTALVAVPFADLCSPPCGDQDIILTPNFAWEAVDGATGYDIELATTETFTAGVIRGSSTVNAWVLTAPLDYATTYYWRVRAEKDGVFSAWTICLFTTMEKAVAPPPPVTITPAPPAPQVNIPPAEMITPNWIYAIIAIGAALCVVVIVLIVRTRRPPA